MLVLIKKSVVLFKKSPIPCGEAGMKETFYATNFPKSKIKIEILFNVAVLAPSFL